MKLFNQTVAAVLLLLGFTLPALAASEIRGFMLADGVTGRDATPHHWADQKIYILPEKAGPGAGTQTSGQPAGWFSLKRPGGLFPAGIYTMYSLAYDGIPAFDFVSGINIAEGTAIVDHQRLKTSAHYSVLYDKRWTEWDAEPWIGGTDFFQTFIAKGKHVTRIATKLADKSPAYTDLVLNYAIYKAGEGAPSTWERISPVRNRFLSAHTDPIIHIFSVPFRSSEVVLIPGERYAVRFWRDETSQSERFVICARKDNGTGYAEGQLYVDGEPKADLDVYAYVSGGAEGTIVNHAPLSKFDSMDLLGGNTRFGQTFKASGKGLAAVDAIYARGAGDPLDIPITFQLYDKPGGKPLGPAKTVHGIPGSFQARAAAFWSLGEVPLKPGVTYYIEGQSAGLNIWKANEDIPGGDAWLDGVSKAPADLMMSIAEYED